MTIEAGAQVFVGQGGLTILDGYDLDLSVPGLLELSASTLYNEGTLMYRVLSVGGQWPFGWDPEI